MSALGVARPLDVVVDAGGHTDGAGRPERADALFVEDGLDAGFGGDDVSDRLATGRPRRAPGEAVTDDRFADTHVDVSARASRPASLRFASVTPSAPSCS
jgi:hypothetical protein